MVRLDLTREQAQLLCEVLESTLSDLRYEIADTDLKDFRDMLKARKSLLIEVTEALKAA